MSLYQNIREAWRKPTPEFKEFLRQRLIEWRKEPVTLRVEHPTRLDRARAIGYRAKPGFIIIRQRVNRGGRMKPQIRNGRRPKRYGRKSIIGMNYQYVAEQRASKKYPNLEVLNSYYLAQDGMRFWFEIILVDKNHPSIKADKRINWISRGANRSRLKRGLTHAASSSKMA